MRGLLVDTSAWYALADLRDPDHASVARCLGEMAGGPLTTNFVMHETVTLIRYRLGFNEARKFRETLLGGTVARVARILPRDERRAWEILTRYRDKGFSYTDCTSFSAMQRFKLKTAAAIDADFRAFGLECLPGSP